MTQHDDVRQILHDTGFKFEDGRTALDMTDEEVEKFVVEFVAHMSKFFQQMIPVMQQIGISIKSAMVPLQNLGKVLAENDERDAG